MSEPMSANAALQKAKGAVPAACLTILLLALYRLAPHPWNVAPAGALFLLGGLYLGGHWRGWAIPFAAMVVSDALLYWRWEHVLWRPERIIDYLAFTLVGLLGRAIVGRPAATQVAGVAAAPVLFYLVSNFGVWLASRDLYAHTPQGLLDCYVAGLPFFRGTLIGDWVFAGAGILAVESWLRLSRSDSRLPACPIGSIR